MAVHYNWASKCYLEKWHFPMIPLITIVLPMLWDTWAHCISFLCGPAAAEMKWPGWLHREYHHPWCLATLHTYIVSLLRSSDPIGHQTVGSNPVVAVPGHQNKCLIIHTYILFSVGFHWLSVWWQAITHYSTSKEIWSWFTLISISVYGCDPFTHILSVYFTGMRALLYCASEATL